jgi:pimeloyl-ACP methyl ester carboxylesterase
MPSVQADDARLFYLQRGTGPDVVMIHGLAANMAFWYLQVVPLLSDHFRVTVYDLRGHGLSDTPPAHYTSADMARDLRALLDALRIERAHVVGHSFGGGVALQFAAMQPERVSSLTIVDSRIRAIQPDQDASAWPQPQAKARRSQLRRMGIDIDEHALDYGLLTALARRRRLDGRTRQDRGEFMPFNWRGTGRRSAERWLHLLEATTARRDFGAVAGLTRARLRSIDRPTRGIYGQRSFCLPSGRGLSEVLPDCDLVVVPEGGHFHPVVQPLVFAGHLRDFLLRPPRPDPAARARR